jgi:hypothetical protein
MRVSFSLLLLLCCSFLFAQSDTFQIKDYTFRTPGFKALELHLSLNGNHSSSQETNAGKNSNNSLGLGPFFLNYLCMYSTDSRLHTSDFLVSVRYQSTESKRAGKQSSDNGFNFTGQWNEENRFYRSHQWFLEFGNQLSLDALGTKNSDSFGHRNAQDYELNNRLILGIGKGRMERVQDAQTALFILNDLQQQGLLQGSVTKEQAFAFAQFITDINNRRVFDFRRRRVYELTRLDSFLKSSGLAPVTGIRHFTTINDNWALALNAPRMAGWNVFFRLRPKFILHHYRSESEQNLGVYTYRDNVYGYSFSPQMGFEKQIPVSLQWQHGYGVSASFETEHQEYHTKRSNEPDGKFNYARQVWTGDCFYTLGFFPNNRTIVNANVKALVSYIQYDNDQSSSLLFSPSFVLSAKYFLTYRAYLNGFANLFYQHSEWRSTVLPGYDRNDLNAAFGVSLSYFIF